MVVVILIRELMTGAVVIPRNNGGYGYNVGRLRDSSWHYGFFMLDITLRAYG